MGMSCTFYRATNDEIDALVDDPDMLPAFIERLEGPAPKVRQVRPKGMLGIVMRLLPITIEEVVPEPDEAAPAYVPDPEKATHIDKGWHGLHFLLTGAADGGDEPASYLVSGGEAIDDEGYGRALRPDQVQQFSKYLSGLSREELARRYDPERMRTLEIYPDAIWTRDPSEETRDWLLGCFADVEKFMAGAAATGHGVIIHIS